MISRKSKTMVLRFGILGAIIMGSVACLDVQNDEEIDGGSNDCGFCHLELGTSPVHTAHVGIDGMFGSGYACTECHLVPDDWFVEDHIDGVVQVVFPADGLASRGGVTPYFDGARCENVYCHGATLGGGTYTEPRWNDPELTQGMGCGDCHGIPPLQPHPSEGACSQCHSAAYVKGELSKDKHIDGVLDFAVAGGDEE